jgi:hypothetical protein
MYKNGKVRPVGTIPKMGVGAGIKENDVTTIYRKNFCKCHNVPPVQQ